MTKHPPARITLTYLENVALHYLERYASSSTNLKRVLLRRIDRSVDHWEDDRDAAISLLDQVLQKMTTLGYLDDARYALTKAQSIRAKGGSSFKIRAGLAAKGIGKDLIETTFLQLEEQEEGGDLAAAQTYARKRRLGPFRLTARADYRQKDLAAMGRAGFSWEMAKDIIDAEGE